MIISSYGTTTDGHPVRQYTLRSDAGAEVGLIDYGAAISAIRVPDARGAIADIALGFDALPNWEAGSGYHGAIVGRYGNRINRGRFTLDGRDYALEQNDKGHHLHGGRGGFSRRTWTGEPVGENAVRFTYVSPDGEEGYPGTLTTEVTYTLGDENDLTLDYRLTADATTIANVTNHCYFNLGGEGSGTILDHEMMIHATRYVITDAGAIPTGELPPVEGTPMDFRRPTAIGARIDADFKPLRDLIGYDHTYVLDGEGYRKGAEVFHAGSGRVLTVLTTEPGVQFYTGNYLNGAAGKNGHRYDFRTGFCLETQRFPDSPNHPHFPTVTLRPGEVRTSRTTYRFGVR